MANAGYHTPGKQAAKQQAEKIRGDNESDQRG